METDRERGGRECNRERERETVRLAEISNHASLYMGHRQRKIRWCCEMELLSFNPSNVPRDTHQITTEPSVHSHTYRGERTQPDPPTPCCSPSSSLPLLLSPRLCSMLRGGVKEMGRQWRCGWEHTRCPVPHCLQMKWHSLCLSCTGSASLKSSLFPQIASNLSFPWSHRTELTNQQQALSFCLRVQLLFLLKLNWIPAALRSLRAAQLSAAVFLPITAAQMCVLPSVAVNYLIN